MSDTPDKPWCYSHTQLQLWRACPRRYYHSYVLGEREETTANMAAGTWLLHTPIETWLRYKDTEWSIVWESVWANFLAEWGGPDDYEDKVFNLKVARKLLDAYKANPIPGTVTAVEDSFYLTLPGGYRYQSKPDFVVESDDQRTTVDLKLRVFANKWRQPEPLEPFDDQCLGQAIAAGADRFIRYTFGVDRDTEKVRDPLLEEFAVDPVLKREWVEETNKLCRDIEDERELLCDGRGWDTWPKHQQACHSYGKPCPYLAKCRFGLDTHHVSGVC